MTLDVRQDALLHRRVLGELLGCKDWEQRDPQNRAETLAHLIRTNCLPSVFEDSPTLENVAGAWQFTSRPDARTMTKFERRGQRLGQASQDLIYRVIG